MSLNRHKGNTVMKKLLCIFAVVFFFPSLVIADGPQYEESLYVFQTRNIEPFLDPESPDECGWAIPLFDESDPLAGGLKEDLYSVHTKKTSGEVLNGDVKKIKDSGKLVVCFSEGYPVFESGIPLGEGRAFWYLTINNQEYLVGGVLRYRTGPPGFGLPEFPEMGMGLIAGTGTIVVPSAPLSPVGSLTTNTLVDFVGNQGYEPSALVTVRLYTPNE